VGCFRARLILFLHAMSDVWNGIAWIYEKCVCGMNSQCCPWFPCVSNKGYGASTFVSLCIALNIALAKWEPFRKSLTDVEAEFQKALDDEIVKNNLSAKLADNDARQKMALDVMNRESMVQIKERNGNTWKTCRKYAIISSYIGGIFLFMQVSVGFFGGILLLPPFFVACSSILSKRAIRKVAHENVKAINKVLMAMRSVDMRADAIRGALDAQS
jgi:hypothetical protein